MAKEIAVGDVASQEERDAEVIKSSQLLQSKPDTAKEEVVLAAPLSTASLSIKTSEVGRGRQASSSSTPSKSKPMKWLPSLTPSTTALSSPMLDPSIPQCEEPEEDAALTPPTPTTPTSPNSGSASDPGRAKRTSVRSGRENSSDHLMGIRRLVRQKSEREVLVGTPVKEGHANYMLMYDMLTGIRVAVSRCNAKPLRPLEDADFAAAHKLAFDVTGNEMTPSSRYDFKFKDYAPWVFRMIRETFRVDPAEYLVNYPESVRTTSTNPPLQLSLTGKYVLSELGSPGKSGSFFYFSQDYRFIIKTIHASEHKSIRMVLRDYYEHIKNNPETLLSRIFGLHRVKLPGKRKIHFVVMGNVFPPNKDIHETYDLKGSTIGRAVPEEIASKNPRAVLKDINWIDRGRKLLLGPTKRKILIDMMDKDVAFLKKMNIMDYSLLIGCHDLVKGNKDKIRDNTLAVFEPNAETLSRRNTAANRRGSKASAVRRMIAHSDPIQLGPSSSRLPEELPPERKFCVFYKDMGGFRATDENDADVNELYYIGIIDIFTKYDNSKKIEHFFKSLTADGTQISAVNPIMYGNRFLKFMKGIISGYVEPAEDHKPDKPVT
ncbi:Phosphatidylinositol-4-phosphate 5-kinase [Chytridiales sp. JEL 0842]|nr:Phosphatidylinositol-4-phosphate 5-kinase [Chytridiales sp. JEL 0842]